MKCFIARISRKYRLLGKIIVCRQYRRTNIVPAARVSTDRRQFRALRTGNG